jgi:hypothetical protein
VENFFQNQLTKKGFGAATKNPKTYLLMNEF